MSNAWEKVRPIDLYNAMKDMTPAERFLEVEKSRQVLMDSYRAKVRAKEQEIIEHIRDNIEREMDYYKDEYGSNYREAMREDKAYFSITDKKLDMLINDYMELLYD